MRISDWSSDVCSSDLAGFAGRGDMGAEAALLPFPVAMVVIIIQAGLSYADDARMGCALDQLRGIDMRMLVRLMRMDADGRPDVWFAQRGVQHIVPLAFACGDVEHQSDAEIGRAHV